VRIIGCLWFPEPNWQAPAFVQFMTEMKTQNEKYRREFGDGQTQ